MLCAIKQGACLLLVEKPSRLISAQKASQPYFLIANPAAVLSLRDFALAKSWQSISAFIAWATRGVVLESAFFV